LGAQETAAQNAAVFLLAACYQRERVATICHPDPERSRRGRTCFLIGARESRSFASLTGRLLRFLQGSEFCAGCYFEKWDAGREIFPRQAVYSLSIRQKYFSGNEVCAQNRKKGEN
jgi:hypothetical protein